MSETIADAVKVVEAVAAEAPAIVDAVAEVIGFLRHHFPGADKLPAVFPAAKAGG